RQRPLQHYPGTLHVTFLHGHASQVHPPIGIRGIGLGDMLERRGCSLQISLQEQADAIIVPPLPIGLLGGDSRGLSRRASREHMEFDGIFGQSDNRQIWYVFQFARYARRIPIKGKLAVIIRAGGLGTAGILLGLASVTEVGVPPGELAIAHARRNRDFVSRVRRYLKAVMNGVGGAWRDEANVHYGARGPCIPLVDWVAVLVHL